MSDQVARWQDRLDRLFPQGAICTWDRSDSPVYRVPRIEVTGVSGLDPVVRLPVFGPEKVIGPVRVLSYSVLQRAPAVQVRVTLENTPAMLWSSGIGPRLARAMLADRQRLLRTAPHGGPAVLTGVPEGRES